MTDPMLGRHEGVAATASGSSGPSGASTGPAADRPTRGAAAGRGAHRSRTADVSGRVEALERALEVAGDRLDAAVRRQVADAAAGVRERLALGIDHTIVALVGGTGSGKSSLFNAVCGLPFADVGVRRPTTSQVTACVWGPTGQPLLDWLGVAPERRIERETALDGDAQADLRGLVLLDLPDYDSVEPEHRSVVDRLLPMVDLLVWVVDPQKYADDALHTGYLRGLAGHEAAMVVVLNQVDTIPPDGRERLVTDVRRLLVEDGLVGVRVLATSVPTGLGIADLRATLAGVVAGPSVAAVRAGAEVGAAARLLGGQVAASEPDATDLPTGRVVDQLAEAAGLPAVAATAEASVRARGPSGSPAGGVQPDAVELARHRWLTEVGAGLPAAWRRSLAEQVTPSDALRASVDRALATVTVATRRPAAPRVTGALAILAGVTALVLGTAVVLGPALGGVLAAVAPDPAAGPVLTGALLLAALALAVVTVVLQRRAGRRRADAVRRQGREALEAVVTLGLAAPSGSVLAEHREVRELAAAAGATPSPVAAGAGASTG